MYLKTKPAHCVILIFIISINTIASSRNGMPPTTEVPPTTTEVSPTATGVSLTVTKLSLSTTILSATVAKVSTTANRVSMTASGMQPNFSGVAPRLTPNINVTELAVSPNATGVSTTDETASNEGNHTVQ